MAERSGFFNARLQDGVYDRTYQAEDFADCLSLFIPNGIYVEDSETLTGTIDKTTVQGLKPYARGKSLFIKEGKAFINGYWYVLDGQDLKISLTVNTTKAIALMYVAADRRMRVELLDLVGGQPDIPKTDIQYGILLGTVSYTSDGVLVTDLREDFMNNSPKHMKAIADKAEKLLTSLDSKVKEMLLLVYPVGSIYMSNKSTNPSSLFGGTWVEWGKGRVPVGVNTSDPNFSSVEKTGGASTVTLTTKQIPSHTHHIGGEAINYNGKYAVEGSGFYTAQLTGSVSRTDATGEGQAHNNLQPYITCYMWKRTV